MRTLASKLLNWEGSKISGLIPREISKWINRSSKRMTLWTAISGLHGCQLDLYERLDESDGPIWPRWLQWNSGTYESSACWWYSLEFKTSLVFYRWLRSSAGRIVRTRSTPCLSPLPTTPTGRPWCTERSFAFWPRTSWTSVTGLNASPWKESTPTSVQRWPRSRDSRKASSVPTTSGPYPSQVPASQTAPKWAARLRTSLWGRNTYY